MLPLAMHFVCTDIVIARRVRGERKFHRTLGFGLTNFPKVSRRNLACTGDNIGEKQNEVHPREIGEHSLFIYLDESEVFLPIQLKRTPEVSSRTLRRWTRANRLIFRQSLFIKRN